MGTAVGTGGIVGRGGVLVGSGVGGVETDGTGAIVGGFVWVGGGVGEATGGETVGVAVRALVALGNVAAGPGSVCGEVEPAGGEADADAVALAGASLGEL